MGDKDNAALMNNLHLLQNKAAKLILDTSLHSSATEALSQLGGVELRKTEALSSLPRCL